MASVARHSAEAPSWQQVQSPDLHHYEADHAFVNKTRPEVYNEACATLAWNRTVTFLQQYLHK